MAECVFCRIVTGEAPADLMLQNERVVAFLDIHPVAAGHALVAPRAHSDSLSQASDADMAALMKMARRIGERQRERLGATGYNILMAVEAPSREVPAGPGVRQRRAPSGSFAKQKTGAKRSPEGTDPSGCWVAISFLSE